MLKIHESHLIAQRKVNGSDAARQPGHPELVVGGLLQLPDLTSFLCVHVTFWWKGVLTTSPLALLHLPQFFAPVLPSPWDAPMPCFQLSPTPRSGSPSLLHFRIPSSALFSLLIYCLPSTRLYISRSLIFSSPPQLQHLECCLIHSTALINTYWWVV